MRLSLTLLLAAAPLAAQQAPSPLSLQDAIQMAQHQGPSAQVARSVRDAARSRNDAFNASLLPQVVLSGDGANLYRGMAAIPLADGTTSYVSQAQNLSSLGLSVAQKIPLTGGTLSVGTSASRLDVLGDQTGRQATRQYTTTPFFVSISQDLFRPRDLVWNERLQALNASVAERAFLEAREDVAGTIAGAFFDLYAAEMSLKNAQGNVTVNDTLYTLNKGRFEVGKIGENDLLKSELQLLRARASLEDAKVQRDRAEAALRRQLVYPDSRPLSIITPDAIPTVDADPDVAVREALKNSSAIEQNHLDETQAQRGLTSAKLLNRFNASVTASVGFNATAPAFSQAYQNTRSKQTAVVGLNMPVIQWGAGRAQVEAAKADEQRVQANNKSRRDALAEDARFSVLNLQQAQRNLLIAAKADTVSAKQFEVARNRYIIGKISNTDLYNAQNDKDQALISYVQALRSYWTSYYHLRRVTLYDFEKKEPLSDNRDR